MPYIGNQPGTGVRSRFIYTATASQTTFSGADDNSKTLKYADSAYVDVFLNGICLVPGTDYTASTKTSIVLTQAASLNDTLEVVAYDIATISDTVSKADGGNFEAGINVDGNLGIRTTSPSDDIEINPSADEKGITLKTTSSIRPYLNFDANRSGANQQVMRIQGKWNGTNITRIESVTGDDTTNKDNGYLVFQTASDSSSLNERMRIDSSGNVGIGTTTVGQKLVVDGNIQLGTSSGAGKLYLASSSGFSPRLEEASNSLAFYTNNSERARFLNTGVFLISQTADVFPTTGVVFGIDGTTDIGAASNPLDINRSGTDGSIIRFFGQGTEEGEIKVLGTTVSLVGGHLSRWSQLTNGSKDTSILRGTVMTNLDQMAVWSHDAVEAQDAVLDDDGNLVSRPVEAKDAYTEDNEQLNCMAVSSVEGDVNVAGVFEQWDEEEDGFNDLVVAMTGDNLIRIAQGTTVARGDLLMSAGDGTAKPQGDDIVRSKTVAKVTSTNVSHTYDDGSYLVPCVLMAC